MKHTWKKATAFVLAMALVVGAAPANVGTGGLFGGTSITAYADETETLLTTITATGIEQASFSTENVANVSFSYSAQGSSAYTNNGKINWGWWGYGWTATVTPAEGYTITKCVFYDDANRTATDSEAPFVVETTEEDKTPQVNGTPILANQSKGITKIEVYGYATPAAKTDISDATVNLASDNSVASITVGEDTITDLSDFDITYGTDDSHTATAVPTDAGTYYAYVTPKSTNTAYTGTAKSAEFTVTASAEAKTETLLTTLTFGGSPTYSETTSGVVSVTATNVTGYSARYGWLWYNEGSLSVTAEEGYTITKCVFIQNAKTPITDTEAPFEIHSDGDMGHITEDTRWAMDGVTSIEVYGYATPAAKTDISTATVTLDTDNKVSAVTLGETTIDSTEYDVTYGATAETASADFPTAPGKYYAFVTAKTDSENYTGTATSEQFVVNGTLADGTYKQTASKDEKYYTRFVFVKPKSEIEGKSKAKFTAHYNGTDYPFETTSYYTGMTSNGISYTLESEDSVMFVVTITSGSDISADLTCDIDFE